MASVGTIKYKNGSSWIDILHPVNSFYFSYASTSPSSLFGGTWTQVTNAALRGATSTGYTGSDTCTLTTAQIPSHSHHHNAWTYMNADGSGNMGWISAPAGSNIKYANIGPTNQTGGGGHTPTCNAPSTVISGIAQRKLCKRGDC